MIKHIAFFRCKWCTMMIRKEFNPKQNSLRGIISINTDPEIGRGHHCLDDEERFGRLEYLGYRTEEEEEDDGKVS